MPIIKASIKDLRKANKRRAINRTVKDTLKSEIKALLKLHQEKRMDEFMKKLPSVVSTIDKAAKNNFLHKNNAARKKARFARLASKK